MTKINYPLKADPKKTANAAGENIRISHKSSIEICNFITGKKIDFAIKYLEDVIQINKALPFVKFVTHQAHRKGNMRTGRYPVNASIEIVKLLKNAKNNAENKGLNKDKLRIKNAQANSGRHFSRGRRSFGRRQSKSATVHIVVEESLK
ncbi:MAG: 50S ribosomal protein L22 [DPANN group archaeon]|nr:50S ribosomal protein L22 [DPANN group archaeon]